MCTVFWRFRLHVCNIQVLAVCIIHAQPPLRVLFLAHMSSGLSLVGSAQCVMSHNIDEIVTKAALERGVQGLLKQAIHHNLVLTVKVGQTSGLQSYSTT